MNENNRSDIKNKILEEIDKTEHEIFHYKELTKPIPPENAIGRVSRMDAINNKSVNEAALRKSEQKLKGLRIALSNIGDPEFGQCAKCKQEIPLGRILLLPHARFCVNCAR
ncbi:MAG: hypothetical protein HKN00_01685 [Flavobacteriaceae bacterium]|nr:TraR/DksA C4-type zinc finger protein [Bacteroidia bacterium]MBT8288437.1 TraR/DksA C4-type zinc finger protein [Bacteroidia bacterium]NNF73865.1 hypothetical protein [Flavobacteriaceae bacterium]